MKAPGDAVVGLFADGVDGAATEYLLAPAEVLTAAPRLVPFADAGALPPVGLTAWQAPVAGRAHASQNILTQLLLPQGSQQIPRKLAAQGSPSDTTIDHQEPNRL